MAKTRLGDIYAEGEVVQVAAAVRVPPVVRRPGLELHSAGGQAVIAESVVTQVVDQPVHILGERGQVLEGRGTAAARPHPAPQFIHPPTPPASQSVLQGPADVSHSTQLPLLPASGVSKGTVGKGAAASTSLARTLGQPPTHVLRRSPLPSLLPQACRKGSISTSILRMKTVKQ